METEVRCPVGPQRLFMKLITSGERVHVTEDNLMEFACSDCRRALRSRGQQVALVLHRYNLLGQHIEDEIIRQAFQSSSS